MNNPIQINKTDCDCLHFLPTTLRDSARVTWLVPCTKKDDDGKESHGFIKLGDKLYQQLINIRETNKEKL